jgi:phosphohistidine phosphatase
VKSRLYVLQHGHALSKDEDAERPLSDDGRRDVERIAGHLSKNDVLIHRIFHSGKLRAHQTADIISEKAAPDVTPEKISGIAPNDDPAAFIKLLDDIEGAVLIASHMPFVSNLCSTLLIDSAEAQFGFTPGSVACLGYEEGRWSLLCMIRPDIL